MKTMLKLLLVAWFVSLPLQAQSLAITRPVGGETWDFNSLQSITWKATGYTGKVRLVLFDGTTKLGLLYDWLDATAGSFTWRVGYHVEGSTPAGANYRIRIVSADGTLGDYSEPFAINRPQPIVRKPSERLPPVRLKFPRLEVSRIWLAPNLEGFAIVFNYQNAGEAPLPRAADLPEQPDFQVLLDGGPVYPDGSGALFIPTFPAPPGWEQVGYAGPSIRFRTWRELGATDLSPRSYISGPPIPDTTTVIINRNRVLGMESHSLTVPLRPLALRFAYDVRCTDIQYDWSTHEVKVFVHLDGKIPEGREITMGCYHEVVQAQRWEGWDETREVTGHQYLYSRKVDPGERSKMKFNARVRVKPLGLDERVFDIDLRNNFLEKTFVR